MLPPWSLVRWCCNNESWRMTKGYEMSNNNMMLCLWYLFVAYVVGVCCCCSVVPVRIFFFSSWWQREMRAESSKEASCSDRKHHQHLQPHDAHPDGIEKLLFIVRGVAVEGWTHGVAGHAPRHDGKIFWKGGSSIFTLGIEREEEEEELKNKNKVLKEGLFSFFSCSRVAFFVADMRSKEEKKKIAKSLWADGGLWQLEPQAQGTLISRLTKGQCKDSRSIRSTADRHAEEEEKNRPRGLISPDAFWRSGGQTFESVLVDMHSGGFSTRCASREPRKKRLAACCPAP